MNARGGNPMMFFGKPIQQTDVQMRDTEAREEEDDEEHKEERDEEDDTQCEEGSLMC